jgi:hypothetical protein
MLTVKHGEAGTGEDHSEHECIREVCEEMKKTVEVAGEQKEKQT